VLGSSVCAGVAWCPFSPSAPKGYHFSGVGGGAWVGGWVRCAAADPGKVIGLRPLTGRTDTPRCVRVQVTMVIDLPVFGVV